VNDLRDDIRYDFERPFDILEPKTPRGPVVFNSPHSGRAYPREFLASSRLDIATLRRSEDTFVDDLVRGVVACGYPMMRAHFPRCFVDVNREPYELDPRMFDGRLPSFANTRSMRVAGGLGTVARVVGDAQEIYGRRLPVDDALQRIETLYKPYHRALRALITRTQRAFEASILIDCHSMPSTPSVSDERPRADVVIGDRYGTSCAPQLTDLVETTWRGLGYVVSRNKPYAGGFITEHYGNPATGLHAIQIEINRAIYMDERAYRTTAAFANVASAFVTLAERIGEIPLSEWRPFRTAAE
jgi:N-formylglutamate deformylase